MAQSRFERLGVPHVRPDDYFAEMLKTDKHMEKVKRRMVQQQQDILSAEDRRKQKANKKFGKQVQRETLVARAQQKKRDIAEVSSLRKKRKGQVSGARPSLVTLPLAVVGLTPSMHDRSPPADLLHPLFPCVAAD